tara:strand:- start:901 stop:1368 length:468 start_codon:yes stop_codon:yes gene_type:complete
MKNGLYILIIVFLTSGKSVASSFDFFNIPEGTSSEKPTSNENHLYFENVFCHHPLNNCSDYKFLMSKEGITCTMEPSQRLKEIKIVDVANIYYTSITNWKTLNNLNHKPIKDFNSPYTTLLNLEHMRSQKINLEEHNFQLMDPNYFRGFGIRMKI